VEGTDFVSNTVRKWVMKRAADFIGAAPSPALLLYFHPMKRSWYLREPTLSDAGVEFVATLLLAGPRHFAWREL
jgi:hypothetical protein